MNFLESDRPGVSKAPYDLYCVSLITLQQFQREPDPIVQSQMSIQLPSLDTGTWQIGLN